MLLTLSARSLRGMLTPGRTGRAKLDLFELPDYTRQVLGLHGLVLPTDLLAGRTQDQMERLRERADKAAAAILLLVENDPQPLGSADEGEAAGGVDRLGRVIEAGHLLGCNAVAVHLQGAPEAEWLSRTAERLRRAVRRAERLELNVLVFPGQGLTEHPEKVTELITRVGGFRVGTYPDFQAAVESGDPATYLRRLTPYASVVCVSTVRFSVPKDGKEGLPCHAAYPLEPLVEVIEGVGYDGTLAIEYRGTGDATLGVRRTKQVLESLLGTEEQSEE